MNELLIYGDIGTGQLTTQAIADQLKTIEATVTTRINSAGGDVIEGLGIYNLLKERGNVDVYIDGIAASMASVIAMAGKKIYMAENALLMIHKPWSGAQGNSDALREQATLLDKFEVSLTNAYTSRTNLPKEKIAAMLAQETWLDAAEALKLGFVDEITGANAMAASVDLSRFKNPPQQVVDAALQNAARIQGIKSKFKSFATHEGMADLQVACLADPTVTADNVGQRILAKMAEDSAPITPRGYVVDMNQNTSENFITDASDALLLRAGIRPKNVSAGARDLAKYSVPNLAESYLKLQGMNTTGMDSRKILSHAFTIQGSGQHTTSDFSFLLGNTVGRSLQMAYEEEPVSFSAWTGEIEAPDFKERTLIQLSEAPPLDYVGEGGEYKNGSFSDSGEKFKLLKYGKIFSITYEALINDDLNGFGRLPAAFGKAARRKEADLVYETLTSNPTMNDGKTLFHADHGNIAAVSGDITLPTLQAGRLLMRKQTDMSGAAINVTPRFLIVPAHHESQAEQLLASLVDPSKSNDTPNNAFVRGLELVVDSRLDSQSVNYIYLASSPSQVDTISRAYLAGASRPYYESQDGWRVDGVEVKTRLKVAAFAADHRGLVRIDLS